MTKVQYAEFLDALRRQSQGEQTTKPLLEGATLARKREATKRLEVRLSPEHRSFLRKAAKATNSPKVDESAIVAVAIALVQELDVPWEAIASREELVAAVRRRLRSRERSRGNT